MKKICFITTISSTMKNFILKTAKYLHKEGDYDITFICNSDDEFEKILPKYIKYIPVNMKRGVKLGAVKATYEIYKIFKKEKFDCIQYSTPNAALYASIAGKLANIKVRLYCQWGIRYVGFEKGVKRRIFKMLEKIICNNSTWIEPDSFGNLKFSQKEKLYSTKKSSVIWNGSASGVDLKKFDINNKESWNVEIRKKYNIDLNDIVIGYIGRLDKDKGVNELLNAFKSIIKQNNNDIKLLIVGGKDKINNIDKNLYNWAKNEKKIIFTGRVSDVEKYYAALDIFTLPSYREGFGSVVVEAEAMGVPVVVTDIPGPTDAIEENKTGLIVKVKDSKSLEKGLNVLIKDKNKREKMGANSFKLAKNKFDSEKFLKYVLEDRNRLIKE